MRSMHEQLELEIEVAFKNAYSMENRKAHGAEGLNITYIGKKVESGRVYVLYKDSGGNYWYQTGIKVENEVLPEYEAIFGKKKKQK